MNTKHRILLVDDSLVGLKMYQALLEEWGYEVVPVSSGEEALRSVMIQDFAVILLDVVMPGMDGYETARHLQANERSRDVPIVFLTAYEKTPDEIIHGYEMGVVDYLIKPLQELWLLRTKVAAFVELHLRTEELKRTAAALAETNRRLESEAALRQEAQAAQQRTAGSLSESERSRLALLSVLEDQQRAEEALRRHSNGLAFLNRVARVFSSTLAREPLLASVLAETRALLEVTACSLWLADPDTHELVCQQSSGPEAEVVRGWRLQPGEGLVGFVMGAGHSLNVADTRADSRHFKGVDGQTGVEMRSILTIPLRTAQRTVGVLQACATEAGRFEAADVTLVEALGALAAAALENARLYEESQQEIADRKRAEDAVRQRNREVASLYAASQVLATSLDLDVVLGRIVDQAAEVLSADNANVVLVDDQARIIKTVQRAGVLPPRMAKSRPLGVTRRVLQTGGPLLFDEVADDGVHNPDLVAAGVRSYAAVPLRVEGQIRGVLLLHSVKPAAFAGKLELVTTFANHAAAAVANARLHEEVTRGRDGLRQLSRRLLEVQEAERRHLARELHDELGQLLTGAAVSLELAEGATGAALNESLEDARALLADLLTRVRDLSLDLRPALLDDRGLIPALLWQSGSFTKRTGVEVDFSHTGVETRPPAEVETAVYRVVQEALTNVARHAKAQSVRVRLTATESSALTVTVEDDGAGFDAATAAHAATGGLGGMRERVLLLGGTLTIQSEPGKGTRIAAEMPLGGTAEGVTG
jgi:signal transduction histidine kinase/DNA-binding response OmpR family regulator